MNEGSFARRVSRPGRIVRVMAASLLFAGAAFGGSCIVSGSLVRAPAETVVSASAVEIVANCACQTNGTTAVFDARDVFAILSPAGDLDCSPRTGLIFIIR